MTTFGTVPMTVSDSLHRQHLAEVAAAALDAAAADALCISAWQLLTLVLLLLLAPKAILALHQ
jgi:hypothetical protein